MEGGIKLVEVSRTEVDLMSENILTMLMKIMNIKKESESGNKYLRTA